MAPFPEDVDVFTVPHSRMKSLVDSYYNLVASTNFSNDIDLQSLLMSLSRTFYELKAHEQIENMYIMAKLKAKLKALSITNTAVCNCHADNRLSNIMQLLSQGFSLSSNDRKNYESQLRSALQEFTEHFLPHMQQEEEIFQPLLIKYFTRDELKALKEQVLTEHVIKREEAQEAKYQECEKQILESEQNSESCERTITDLPPEVMVKICSYLDPRDLCRCAQVCHQWSAIAMDGQMWWEITPVEWANGNWCFKPPDPDPCDLEEDLAIDTYRYIDEDADIDESADSDSSDSSNYSDVAQQIRQESRVLTGLIKYVLPKVGQEVATLTLANSKGITNSLFHKMVQLCPNLEQLNLSQTRIGDAAFKSFGKTVFLPKLKKLVLSGCVNITDCALQRLDASFQKSICSSGQYDKDTSEGMCEMNKPSLPCCIVNDKDIRSQCVESVDVRMYNRGCCHSQCCEEQNDNQEVSEEHLPSIEDCVLSEKTPDDQNLSFCAQSSKTLEHLDLSGCHLVSDEGLSKLTSGGLPRLRHLDLSGCMNLTGRGLQGVVDACPALVHELFFYCDNISDGPLAETASGCNNVDCHNRVCCRALVN